MIHNHYICIYVVCILWFYFLLFSFLLNDLSLNLFLVLKLYSTPAESSNSFFIHFLFFFEFLYTNLCGCGWPSLDGLTTFLWNINFVFYDLSRIALQYLHMNRLVTNQHFSCQCMLLLSLLVLLLLVLLLLRL